MKHKPARKSDAYEIKDGKIVRKKKVLPYAPRKWKIVLDVIFEKA